MVSWNNNTFNGQVMSHDENVLTACIYTLMTFSELIPTMNGVKEVVEFTNEEDRTVYSVSGPKSAKIVSANTYYVEFSTKLPLVKQLENAIQVQSDAIDDLLVMVLEG